MWCQVYCVCTVYINIFALVHCKYFKVEVPSPSISTCAPSGRCYLLTLSGRNVQHKPSPVPPRAQCLPHKSWQVTFSHFSAHPISKEAEGAWEAARGHSWDSCPQLDQRGVPYHTMCWAAIKTAGGENKIWKNSSSAVHRKKTSCLLSLFDKCINQEIDDKIKLFFFLSSIFDFQLS